MLILLFIIFSSIAILGNNFCYAKADEIADNKATIIASKCYLYFEQDFSKVIEINDEKVFLKHGDIVTIINMEEGNDFALIESEKFDYEGNIYIYKYYLSQNTPQEVYPVFNGKLRRNAMLYDIELKEKFILKKNTRVFIYDGFNKSEYTAVQVQLQDKSLYIGYVKTENIKPDGINGILIAGISIIAAAVTIILSLVFIKKKNKQTKQKT